MLKVHPLLASAIMVAIYSIFSLLLLVFSDPLGAFASAIFSMAAVVISAFCAGFYSSSRPMLVALMGAVGIWCVQLVMAYFILGALSLNLVLLGLQDDIILVVVSCVVCVAAFLLRRRHMAVTTTA